MCEFFYEDTGQVKRARKTLPEQVEDLEQNLIEKALKAYGGNKSQSAVHLGLNRTTLVEKMKKYGLVVQPIQAVDVIKVTLPARPREGDKIKITIPENTTLIVEKPSIEIIPVLTEEDVKLALQSSSDGANELNRNLKETFTLSSESANMRLR